METRRLIVALAASMLVFMVWMIVGPRIMPMPPRPLPHQASSRPATETADREAPTAATTQSSRPAKASTTSSARIAAAPAPDTGTAPASKPAPPDALKIEVAEEFPKRVVLGSDDPKGSYRLMLTLNSRGGAIDEADLAPVLSRYRNYPIGDPRADLDKKNDPFDSYDLLRPVRDLRTGAVHSSLSTQAITVRIAGTTTTASSNPRPGEAPEGSDWHVVDLADKHWSIQRRREPGREVAVCTCRIQSGGKDMLRVTKTYVLREGGYDVGVDLKVESLDGRPHEVIVTQHGPIGVHGLDVRGDSRKVYYALKDGEEITTGNTKRSATVSEKKDAQGQVTHLGLTPVSLPGPGVTGRLLWAALGNQYFAVIMTPVDADQKADSGLIEDTQVIHLTDNKDADENADLTFRFVSKARKISADKPLDVHFDVYAGPKERTAFTDAKNHPSYVARNYMGTIFEEYYSCVWEPLAELMTKLLIGLHKYIWPHNWGLAIIILVLVVRVILHPITKKGQVNMTKMQASMAELQPKLEELKKKYAGDRNKLNQETMALYKREGVNPAGNIMGCLPMVLQMPIWVALWATLSNTIELRHAPFEIIPGRWILDLAAPDALYRFTRPVHVLFFQIDAINLLPPLWGLSMVLQQKLTPKPKSGKTTDQLQQQKRMMYMMAVVFCVMFYSFPSGLTMYIMASNFFGLIEQWRIRQHIEAEQAKPAPVAAADPAAPKKPKSRGLVAALMDRFDKFDKQQRAIKGSKKNR